MIPTEPKWKALIVGTLGDPIFTPEQCQQIINTGRRETRVTAEVGGQATGQLDTKKRTSHISWIPFKNMKPMYEKIEATMKKINQNHFGYEGMEITEMAQYTEYPEGGFYEWHIDSDITCEHEPPVRKISMTCLLSPESEFEGGDLEITSKDKVAPMKQGHAIFFASYLQHRVKPVTRGIRRSLVMWFGGPPLK